MQTAVCRRVPRITLTARCHSPRSPCPASRRRNRPSVHGCPTASFGRPGTWTLFALFYYVIVAVLLYVCCGCCFNIFRRGAYPGWQAMPNREFWEDNVVSRTCPSMLRHHGGGLSGNDDVRFENFPMKADSSM